MKQLWQHIWDTTYQVARTFPSKPMRLSARHRICVTTYLPTWMGTDSPIGGDRTTSTSKITFHPGGKACGRHLQSMPPGKELKTADAGLGPSTEPLHELTANTACFWFL